MFKKLKKRPMFKKKCLNKRKIKGQNKEMDQFSTKKQNKCLNKKNQGWNKKNTNIHRNKKQNQKKANVSANKTT